MTSVRRVPGATELLDALRARRQNPTIVIDDLPKVTLGLRPDPEDKLTGSGLPVLGLGGYVRRITRDYARLPGIRAENVAFCPSRLAAI